MINTINIIRILFFQYIILFILIILSFFLTESLINTTYPILLLIILLVPLFYYFKFINSFLFTPIVFFSLICSIYYGIGPLIYIFGSNDSIKYLDSYYSVNAIDLKNTNILNISSILLILLFYGLFTFSFYKKSNKVYTNNKRVINHIIYFNLAKNFAFIGIIFHILSIYLRFKNGDTYLMPGFIYILKNLEKASIFIYLFLYLNKFKFNKINKLIFIIVFIFTLYNVIFSFMKQEIIEFLFVIFLSFYRYKPSKRLFLYSFLSLVLIFPTLQLFVTAGRILTWTKDSNIASTSDLISNINLENISDFKEKSDNNNIQTTWVRLSSVSAQTFAINSFNSGNAGDTFKNILWSFVPRSIYPDKPIITSGENYTLQVTGKTDAGGTGPGFFGEAFWNLGWLGVIYMSFILGFLMAFFTSYFHKNFISNINIEYISIYLLAISMFYRVDDWFIATTINSIPFLIMLYFLITFIKKIINKNEI